MIGKIRDQFVIVKIIIIINLEMNIDPNKSIRVNNLRGNCKWDENNLSS